MTDLRGGLRVAVATLSVAPVNTGPVADAAARDAMGFAPLVGAVLGAILGALALGLRALHAPPLVTGAVVVALGALLTRGLHLDGLADTVDGLGSYADRQRTLEIMRGPEVGPFGVVALVLVLLIQAAAVTALVGRSDTGLLVGVLTATTAGRLTIGLLCRRGVPPARPDGLGARVAGTVGWPVLAIGAVAVGLVSLAAVPGRLWQGPVAVAAALLCALGLERHAVRRIGGITGDVLGTAVEVGTTVAYVALSFAS